jgi:hypothetical protein
LRRKAVCHLAGRTLLGGEAGATALFHFVGKVPHGLLCDSAPFATCEGSLCYVHGCQNFSAGALAFFPKQEGLLHCVFRVSQPTGLEGKANECFLVRSEIYFRGLQRKARISRCQADATAGGGTVWPFCSGGVRTADFFPNQNGGGGSPLQQTVG